MTGFRKYGRERGTPRRASEFKEWGRRTPEEKRLPVPIPKDGNLAGHKHILSRNRILYSSQRIATGKSGCAFRMLASVSENR